MTLLRVSISYKQVFQEGEYKTVISPASQHQLLRFPRKYLKIFYRAK